LIGSDREGLGLGIIARRSEPDHRSEPSTVLSKYYNLQLIYLL